MIHVGTFVFVKEPVTFNGVITNLTALKGTQVMKAKFHMRPNTIPI